MTDTTPTTEQQDQQAGRQRLACGCIVNLPGAKVGLRFEAVCEDLRETYDAYRELAAGLGMGNSVKRQMAAMAWESLRQHVATERRFLTTGKRPAEKRMRGLGT